MRATSITFDRPPAHEAGPPPELSPNGKPSPLQPEGAFLYAVDDGQLGLPYELAIADWVDRKPKHDKNIGEIATSIITFEDGSRFVMRKTVPTAQEYATSVDFTAPLATRIDGFNTYLGRQLAKRGVHNRAVGTNQAHGFSLLHDAQATLHILGEDDRRQAGQESCEPDKSGMIGYSMGEMKELLALGLAPSMGREVPFSIGMDPCLAEKVDYRRELRNIGCSLNMGSYLVREGLEIPISLGKSFVQDRNPLRTLLRTRHLLDTVGLSPAFLANTYDKWNTLATGETGQYLDDVPDAAVVVIHFFNGSYFNNSQTYKRALADHPNFRAVEEQGLHLSGADSRVIGRVADKAALGLELVTQATAPGELADALSSPILKAAA